jgi:hypothetical protein
MMCASLNINTTGVTCGTGTLSPSGTTEFSPGFIGVRIAWLPFAKTWAHFRCICICLWNSLLVCLCFERDLFFFPTKLKNEPTCFTMHLTNRSVKVLSIIKERHNLRKREIIHCRLSNRYIVTTNLTELTVSVTSQGFKQSVSITYVY